MYTTMLHVSTLFCFSGVIVLCTPCTGFVHPRCFPFHSPAVFHPFLNDAPKVHSLLSRDAKHKWVQSGADTVATFKCCLASFLDSNAALYNFGFSASRDLLQKNSNIDLDIDNPMY